MKRFAILFAAALLALSCAKQAYTPGQPDPATCYRVYFPEQLGYGSHMVRPTAAHEFTFTAARERTSGAITVPVTVDASSPAFVVDPITFADGQATTTFTVHFDGIEEQVEHSFNLTISDPQYASQYRQQRKYVSFSVLVGKRKITPKYQKSWNFIYYSNYYYVYTAPQYYAFCTVPASAGDPEDPDYVQQVLDTFNDALEEHYESTSLSIKTDYSSAAWSVFTGVNHYAATPKSSGATTPGDHYAFMVAVTDSPYLTGDYKYIELTLE